MKNQLIDAIDNLLPQTQCGLCTYGACRPYAEAIALRAEAINKCPPGGVKGLLALAELLQQDPSPYLDEMQQKAKQPSIAIIREDECIGCTKCIQACPVDAILGSAKKMHTILVDQCTGCELCLPPCPVDCIDLKYLEPQDDKAQKEKANQWRLQYQKRNKRLATPTGVNQVTATDTQASRKTAILEAILRSKSKKGSQDESPQNL